MPQTPLKCVKCGTVMEEGFVLDNTYGARLQAEWVEGAPEGSRWMGIKTKGKEHLPVLTYRCPNCAYLESYAPLPQA
jgi:uncharacterized Zn finger protein